MAVQIAGETMGRYGLALLLLFGAGVGLIPAQTLTTPSSAWQKAAGGELAFNTASVREDREPFKTPSFALSADDSFEDPKGRFHADFKLPTYIEFAYKVWLTGEEEKSMLSRLPDWVGTTRFAIQATAPLHATKDQYRLMMQALLAERFGLKLHFQDKEMPVLAMTLITPGKLGPRLIPHSQGQACDEEPRPETFPKACYTYSAMPGKGEAALIGSRATTMPQLANFVGSIAGDAGEIGRRVVDQTGLSGLWDYTLETSMPGHPPAADAGSEVPSTLEALRDQLGIKLKSTRAVVPQLVVDHVELPSAN
jgi:uncharacterized protein (TIGR03435 family)